MRGGGIGEDLGIEARGVSGVGLAALPGATGPKGCAAAGATTLPEGVLVRLGVEAGDDAVLADGVIEALGAVAPGTSTLGITGFVGSGPTAGVGVLGAPVVGG